MFQALTIVTVQRQLHILLFYSLQTERIFSIERNTEPAKNIKKHIPLLSFHYVRAHSFQRKKRTMYVLIINNISTAPNFMLFCADSRKQQY